MLRPSSSNSIGDSFQRHADTCTEHTTEPTNRGNQLTGADSTLHYGLFRNATVHAHLRRVRGQLGYPATDHSPGRRDRRASPRHRDRRAPPARLPIRAPPPAPAAQRDPWRRPRRTRLPHPVQRRQAAINDGGMLNIECESMRPSDFLAAETPLAQHTGKTQQASIAFALRKRWRLFGAGWGPVNALASRACEANRDVAKRSTRTQSSPPKP